MKFEDLKNYILNASASVKFNAYGKEWDISKAKHIVADFIGGKKISVYFEKGGFAFTPDYYGNVVTSSFDYFSIKLAS